MISAMRCAGVTPPPPCAVVRWRPRDAVRGWSCKEPQITIVTFVGARFAFIVVAVVPAVLKRNDAYWGKGEVPLEVTEIVFTPIKADDALTIGHIAGPYSENPALRSLILNWRLERNSSLS